jgi:hypothetical protein
VLLIAKKRLALVDCTRSSRRSDRQRYSVLVRGTWRDALRTVSCH